MQWKIALSLAIFAVLAVFVQESEQCRPDQTSYKGECLNTCPKGCGAGGVCNGKVCQCKQGFALGVNKKHCFPVCQGGCPRGECIRPNVCSGGNAPQPKPKPTQAPPHPRPTQAPPRPRPPQPYPKPVPAPLEVEPELVGLEPAGAACELPCMNGYCSGINRCTCNAGYLLSYKSPYLCCPKSCPENSYCNGFGQCQCNQGFQLGGVDVKICVPINNGGFEVEVNSPYYIKTIPVVHQEVDYPEYETQGYNGYVVQGHY